MFNLDQEILEWRRQLRAAGITNPAPIKELELHLRDEIEELVKSGVDVQQAFRVATHKMGPAPKLNEEFKKVGGTLDDLKQKSMRLYFIFVCVSLLLISLYDLLNTEMSSPLRMLGSIPVVLGALLLWYGPDAYKYVPHVQNKKLRQAMQIAPTGLYMISGAAFMNFVLPRLTLTLGELVVATLWVMLPLLLFSVFGYGLGDRERRKNPVADQAASKMILDC